LTLDDRIVKPKQRVDGGECLRLIADTRAPSIFHEAQAVDFDLIYEDDDVLIVDKPAGLVVHPGAGNPDGTLVNGLLRRRPELASVPRAGIVHRLDKNTSGVMVVAASTIAHKTLTLAISNREIERRYFAIVEGCMVGGKKIDLAIGRDPVHRTRQRAREDGRRATTHVRVVERYRAHTSIEARLETGRTHQIRVHMSATGYPLVGDSTYGARGRLPPRPIEALVTVIQRFSRQALHARVLQFIHPTTGEQVRFESELPPDLGRLIEALDRDRR
jgi:23S rRNA pseudouridine1911/1915/1917 synthase